MNKFSAGLAALFAVAIATPAVAQVGYGKVEQPWFMQGKISGGVSVASSSASTQLPTAGQIAAICNTGAADAALNFGTSNAVAAVLATNTTLKAGTCQSYDLFPFETAFTWMAAISGSSTTLTVETGIGTPTFSGSTVVSGSVNATIVGPLGQAAGASSVPTVEASDSPLIPFAANPIATITRSANTTTYTNNTGWNNGTPTFFSFTGACRVKGGQVLIPMINIWSSANPTLKLTGILWLFSAVPGTNVNDNATFTIASADFTNLTGSKQGFAFTLGNAQVNTGAANSGATLSGVTYQGKCASGTTTITGMVEVTNAYVPANAEVLSVGLNTIGSN